MVNCWIDFKSHRGARKLAEISIEEEGWTIKELDREFETGRESYDGEEEDFRYLEEAERDGWCFVFYTYPHDAPDKDDDPSAN